MPRGLPAQHRRHVVFVFNRGPGSEAPARECEPEQVLVRAAETHQVGGEDRVAGIEHRGRRRLQEERVVHQLNPTPITRTRSARKLTVGAPALDIRVAGTVSLAQQRPDVEVRRAPDLAGCMYLWTNDVVS